MAKRLSLFLLLFICSHVGFSQIDELPIHFGQFFNNPQINPAQAGSEGDFEFSLGTKQNSGVFSGVKTSYASFNSRILKRDRNFHVLGIHFNNDREGDVIRRNRTFLSYSRHLAISEKWMLAAGLNVGLYNFTIKSNPVTGGANSVTEDFGVGLHLYSNSQYLSFSVNQLNGGEVQPLEQIIRLEPIYNLRYSHDILLNASMVIRPLAFVRYADLNRDQDDIRGGMGLKFALKSLVNFGASYEAKEGTHFFLGLNGFTKNFEDRKAKKNNRLNFELGYFAPNLNNTRTNVNAFELTCQYTIF
ncbi:MAG: type IX secretion system PorP/SprF family membrane protein [Patiriisocius sp.]|jgi:type IX secretion system PorP/SprF family membrane protein